VPQEAFTNMSLYEEEAKPKLTVYDHTLKVFRISSFGPDAGYNPGEIAGRDFCHVICDTGCSAKELYGSVW
jgi:hypothetical protein